MELSFPPTSDSFERGLERTREAVRGFGGRLASARGLAAVLVATLAFGVAGGWWLLSREAGLPDFHELTEVDERKAAFFGFLRPIVEASNGAIRADRERLLSLANRHVAEGRVSLLDELWLEALARRYRIELDGRSTAETIAELKLRVDIVPTPLVLVQAAKESGWGMSRFAREANNLFGQWCFREGCGVVPARRPAGANHEVRLFDSIGDAVDAYLRNINTGDAYARLRQIRAQRRAQGEKLTGAALADGLLYYSQRRQAYVEEVKSMLRHNLDFIAGPQP